MVDGKKTTEEDHDYDICNPEYRRPRIEMKRKANNREAWKLLQTNNYIENWKVRRLYLYRWYIFVSGYFQKRVPKDQIIRSVIKSPFSVLSRVYIN